MGGRGGREEWREGGVERGEGKKTLSQEPTGAGREGSGYDLLTSYTSVTR